MIARDLHFNLASWLQEQNDDTLAAVLLGVEEELRLRHYDLVVQHLKVAIVELARCRQWRGAGRN